MPLKGPYLLKAATNFTWLLATIMVMTAIFPVYLAVIFEVLLVPIASFEALLRLMHLTFSLPIIWE